MTRQIGGAPKKSLIGSRHTVRVIHGQYFDLIGFSVNVQYNVNTEKVCCAVFFNLSNFVETVVYIYFKDLQILTNCLNDYGRHSICFCCNLNWWR